MLKNKKIAVLRGGWSAEREVSLTSGLAVLDTLNAAGYQTVDVIVERDAAHLLRALTPKPDIIFNALHGNGGEDGVIQGFLEILGVPYTHSGVTASAVGMDKQLTKIIVAQAGVRVAKGMVTDKNTLQFAPLPYPFVIKPVADGSSVGVHLIFNAADFQHALPLLPPTQKLLMEQYIAGRELTVPVLNGKALTVIEICPTQQFYDFEAKYDAHHHADFSLPAPVPAAIYKEAQEAALKAHLALGCGCVSRSDFRYNPDAPEGEQLIFLETNTQPGMTGLSLVPAAAKHEGMPFLALLETLLENALFS